MSRRVRVISALPVEPRDAAPLTDVPPGVEIVHRVLADDEIDRYADGDAEVLLARRPPRTLEHLPRLRWAQIPTVGVESIVASAPFEQGLTVTNARGVFTTSIAEYVLWAVLDCSQRGAIRRLGQAARRWPDDKGPATGRPLRGQTALIVGYGTLGRETARLLSAFGVRVVAVKARPEVRADDSFHLPGTGDPEGTIPESIAPPDWLVALAAGADMLIVTLPLTPRSRGIVSAEVLDALPDDSLIVNVGRGATVDEAALLEALDGGRVRAAYLDVFSEEPLPPSHPLWSHPLATVTPHVSGGDWRLVFELFAQNLRRYTAGAPLLNVVSPARGY